MSYCRFSSGDVYLFSDVKGGYTCCACSLAPLVKTIFTTGSKNHFLFGDQEPCTECQGEGCKACMIHGDSRFDTKQQALDHLLEHKKEGDVVPNHAIERLKQEIKQET